MGIIKRLLSASGSGGGDDVVPSSSGRRGTGWIPDAIEFSARSDSSNGGGGGVHGDDDDDDDDRVSNLSGSDARLTTATTTWGGGRRRGGGGGGPGARGDSSSSSPRAAAPPSPSPPSSSIPLFDTQNTTDDNVGYTKWKGGGATNNNNASTSSDDVREGMRQFENTMEEFERRLSKIDASKFVDDDDDDDDDEGDDDDDEDGGSEEGGGDGLQSRLSAINDEDDDDDDDNVVGGVGRGNMGDRRNDDGGGRGDKRNGRGTMKFGKFFGRTKNRNVDRGEGGTGRRHHRHRPAVDSDTPSDDDEEEDDEGGYVVRGGNHARGGGTTTTRFVSVDDSTGRGGIGVPDGGGHRMTPAKLEDELYLYKLETLNLTDACRELTMQLEEVESRLGSVQAKATFRIHALEAELQDGNLGLKSLVKMTSTEMDGRLEALRALGKTATIQAAKLRERDHELIAMEGRLRRIRRDVKVLRRENKKVCEERAYLRDRLEELDALRYRLEEDLKSLAMENGSIFEREEAAKTLAQREVAINGLRVELEDALEKVGRMAALLEGKDGELMELRHSAEEKEGEILELREELDRKEHEIIRVEKQLEKVRNDLLDSANAARTAEEARVEAVERESKIHAELEETLAFVEETTHKVALLESREAELINQLARTRLMEKEIENVENQTRMLTKLEKEMEALSIERDDAIIEMNLAQKSYLEGIADRDAQIDTLNQDVDVHREQMELAQTMLVEKETIALELRYQLEETMKEEELRVRELEEKLAAKNRDVNNIATELDERNTYVQSLEEKLATTKREFTKYRADCEVAAAASAELETIDEDDGEDDETVLSMASARTARALAYANMTSQAALLAERVEHLEREVGAGKRQMECQGVELVEKDKHIERIKVELERRKAKIDEAVAKVDERDKTIESLNNELNDERLSLNAVLEKLRNLQIDLADAKEEADAATEACKRAEVNVLAAEIESKHAIDDLENLKSEVESLRKCNESAAAEVEKIKTDAEKEKKSSIHVAATLAATNAARQAEMEAKIENMQKEIESKMREIDAVKVELVIKDETAKKLSTALGEATDDLVMYKESFESKKTTDALERVAHRDYFHESEELSANSASNSESNLTGRGNQKGRLRGLFNRSSTNNDCEDDHVDWKTRAREKDKRISELEMAVADNSLTIDNLKNELLAVSSKFKEDESQRRLLIQRLENENQAYTMKIGVLETEFEEIRKRKEAQAINIRRGSTRSFDGSLDNSVDSTVVSLLACSVSNSSGSGSMGVSSITGKSLLAPVERDNKKLKKQKKVYETRIASLQTQLSEIQQIVPELMSKSKLQIHKLESAIETQHRESKEKERSLTEEIAQLREHNDQLLAATRSRLQTSDGRQQEEIDQLKMRLEVREATIKKLEMMSSSGKFSRMKSLPTQKKKTKKKKAKLGDSDCDISVSSHSVISTAYSAVN